MDTPRYAISKLHFGKFPDPDDFQCWRVSFKTEVCVSASTSELTMPWTHEVDMSAHTDDLMTSQSITGESFPDFEMLDARIASALRKIISSTSFRKRVSVEEQRVQKYCGHLHPTLACDTAQGLSDGSDTRWDQIL